MKIPTTSLYLLCLIFMTIHHSSCNSFESCNDVHGRNFSLLSGSWEVYNQNSTHAYVINICGGLTQSNACHGSAICMISGAGSPISYGDVAKPPKIVASSSSGNFFLEYNTTHHCSSEGNGHFFYRSSITFECGKTLGSPEVIAFDECSIDFLWETSRACSPHATDALDEVKCYGYDRNGLKRDIGFLTLLRGGHFVTNPSSTSTGKDGVYINVCRNIQAGSIPNCPDDAAACLVASDHAFMLGKLTNAVNVTTDNRLVLEYVAPTDSSHLPPQCSGFTPTVKINFVCPEKSRGGSKPPIITSTTNCQYSIEWWTEAACVADSLTSSQCGLNIQSHGVDLDLTPLRRTGTQTHYTTHDSENNEYLLNVCAGTGVQCGDKHERVENAVCQTKSHSSEGTNPWGKIAGIKDGYLVKYVDGQLSLTYSKGDRCRNNLRRSSVILFHCNKTAGIGEPTYNHELHCIYYFDWSTSYACIATPACHITGENGQIFDLSSLTKMPGGGIRNWQVLDGLDSHQKHYFINVCGEVLRHDATASCSEGSSVCMVDSASKAVSYGSYSNSTLTHQNNNLVLIYNGGSECGDGKQKSTKIVFTCRPGDLVSSPIFKYLSTDKCQLVLKWYTAAACPLKSFSGTNCKVSDQESGLTFDLSRLTKSGEKKFYKVVASSYDYYINVCDNVTGTPCNEENSNVAACQHEQEGGQRNFTLGQQSSNLLYYNGFVKLVYNNGAQYSDKIHNRSAQISFLCNTTAGAGTPAFVKEENHTYVFEWYTSYVCPAVSTQCVVTGSSGGQYDLSRLAKSEDDADPFWSTVAEEELPGQHKKRKYYINVCRPVNEIRLSSGLEIACDPFAGACETLLTTSSGKEELSIANLGQPATAPEEEGPGRLVLRYKDGAACTENGIAKKIQTHIHFVCRKGSSGGSPRILSRTNCTVSFEWNTDAACVIGSDTVVVKNTFCEVQSHTSAMIFNLEPLKRKPNNPYKIPGGSDDTYELNVCGAVRDCDDKQQHSFAGCRKSSSGQFSKRVSNVSTLLYSDDGHLSITYNANNRDEVTGQVPSYELSFICNRSIAKGEPAFRSKDGDTVRFDFQTSLACQPQAVDCVATDKYGYRYDLSPLTSSNHAWTGVGGDKRRRYFINVCSPLSSVEGCTSTASGACYTVMDGDGTLHGYNLGLVRSRPEAVSVSGNESVVSIYYTGGDACGSDPNRRYSTRVDFPCSDNDGSFPELQSQADDPCLFHFSWPSPVGCRVKTAASHKGQYCAVTHPLYDVTFDLSSLTKATDYVITTGGEWDYNVNVCSELKQATGSCQGSGACQVSHTSATTMHDAGKMNTTLIYDDGLITLTYISGQPCHGNRYNRSTIFRFTCHHDNIKPSFINESADCTYLIDWPTPKACPPIKIVECIAQDSNGRSYDLSSLSLSHENYAAQTRGDTGGKSYHLNVCRSMLHRPGLTCPPNSAACLHSGNKYMSLGQLLDGPKFVDNKLVLSYAGGDKCESDSSLNYTTTITFECSRNAATATLPVVTSHESCNVEMLWVTKAACPVENNTTPSSESTSPCSAVNPITNHVFSLSSLAHDAFYEVRSESKIFHINVCKKVVDSNCADNTGNCVGVGDSHYSAGEMSSQLTYQHGSLSLRYEGGKTCEVNPKYKHSTVISFTCHRSPSQTLTRPSSSVSLPMHINDDTATCTHYFSWPTFLACEVQTPCTVADYSSSVPHVIDFSPLISPTGHYLAINEAAGRKAAYYINVCRPLEPIRHVACPPGSAVCEVSTGQVTKALGYINPNENLFTYDSESNQATLRYKTSEPCPSNSSATVSTEIFFSCVRGATPNTNPPHLRKTESDCVYVFDWETDLLCPADSHTGTGCAYTDASTGTSYDVTALEPITIKDSRGSFVISPCGAVDSSAAECKDSSACFTSNSGQSSSLGSLTSRKISAGGTAQYPLQITYTEGSKCPLHSDRRKRLTILFRCDRDPSSGSHFNKANLQYDHNEQCLYTLDWPTPYVCPIPSESCIADSPETSAAYDLSLLSSITHAWTFQDTSSSTSYFINVCRGMPAGHSRTDGCKKDAAVCRAVKGNSKAQSLGVLRSQKIEVTSPTTLTLKYTGGDRGLCTDAEMSASTLITFICDKSVTGAPQFEKFSQEDCVLHVTWKTRIACADKFQPVTVDHSGKFTDPKSGSVIDLSPVINGTFIAKEVRTDKNGPSAYNYAVSLAGNFDKSKLSANVLKVCKGKTAVCQYKTNSNFVRKVAEVSSNSPTYTMFDDSLEISISSSDTCGKDGTKKSHVLIWLQCSSYDEIGSPSFLYETNECGYIFQWYNNILCEHISQNTLPPISQQVSQSPANNSPDQSAEQKHNGTGALVGLILFAVVFICFVALLLRKPERRIKAKRAASRLLCFCCSSQRGPKYRYIRSDEFDDDVGTSLFEDDGTREETSLLGARSTMHGSTLTSTHQVDMNPIGGAFESESDDLFELPEVKVETRSKKKTKTKSSKKSSKTSTDSTNPFEGSDDVFAFINSTKTDRAPGVGGEKVESYHDDDDIDMLDA